MRISMEGYGRGATSKVALGACVGSLWLACSAIPPFSLATDLTDAAGQPSETSAPDASAPEVQGSVPDAGKGDGGKMSFGPLRVFVSNEAWPGNFGTIGAAQAEANRHCTEVAGLQAGLAGRRWRAFLWTSAEDPRKEFALDAGGWHQVLEGGTAGLLITTQVALDGTDRTNVQLTNERGELAGGLAWTGGGVAKQNTCNGWGAVSGGESTGSVGLSSATGGWLENSSLPCGGFAHLYCFEQP